MPKVIYKKEIDVNMLGEIKYSVIPTCPVCGEWTYSEDTCPFCRMNGVLTELEYNGAKAPEFLTSIVIRLNAIAELAEEVDDSRRNYHNLSQNQH